MHGSSSAIDTRGSDGRTANSAIDTSSTVFSNATIAFFGDEKNLRGKRARGPPGSRRSPPPMDNHNPRGVTNALPAFQEGSPIDLAENCARSLMPAINQHAADGNSDDRNDVRNQRQG
ncbi:hypothetical protein EVAR_92565_1 [Eumeta japonica]|uniref:Uncharacterized protein n=1 Tax=Eumeta variegata TaxID=151549 RepID=A0A4C1SZ71_EUMVA|nr:hypothetical protein EVAR_92565_1 [Eumeta japonica]